MRKIKIVSDGTRKTQVLDEHGVPLPGVRSVKWSIGVGEVAIAIVEFVMAECEVEGAVFETAPLGDEHKSLGVSDGR